MSLSRNVTEVRGSYVDIRGKSVPDRGKSESEGLGTRTRPMWRIAERSCGWIRVNKWSNGRRWGLRSSRGQTTQGLVEKSKNIQWGSHSLTLQSNQMSWSASKQFASWTGTPWAGCVPVNVATCSKGKEQCSSSATTAPPDSLVNLKSREASQSFERKYMKSPVLCARYRNPLSSRNKQFSLTCGVFLLLPITLFPGGSFCGLCFPSGPSYTLCILLYSHPDFVEQSWLRNPAGRATGWRWIYSLGHSCW